MFNELQRIKKTRKPHRCEVTRRIIPPGSSCWRFVGVVEDDFQSWYMCDEAKEFWDLIPYDTSDFTCDDIGEMMRAVERGEGEYYGLSGGETA